MRTATIVLFQVFCFFYLPQVYTLDEPKPTSSVYQIMPKGTHCPVGTDIKSASVCKQAQVQLGYWWDKQPIKLFNDTNNVQNVSPYCSTEYSTMFFNQKKEAPVSINHFSVCYKSRPSKEIIIRNITDRSFQNTQSCALCCPGLMGVPDEACICPAMSYKEGGFNGIQAGCFKCQTGKWLQADNVAPQCLESPIADTDVTCNLFQFVSTNGAHPTCCAPFPQAVRNATTCTCPRGWGKRNGNCVQCPKGSFQPKDDTQNYCISCPNGTYQNSKGSSDCRNDCVSPLAVNFPNGGATDCFLTDSTKSSFSRDSRCPLSRFTQTGVHFWGCCSSVHQNQTISRGLLYDCECPIGHYLRTGNSIWGFQNFSTAECKPCPRGTSKNSASNRVTVCTSCDSGHYAPTLGSSYCLECPTGKYASQDGAQFCSTCPFGKVASSPSTSTCTSCTSNQQVPSIDHTKCIYCPGGKHVNKTTHTCDTCPLGKYSMLDSDTVNATQDFNNFYSLGCLDCTTPWHVAYSNAQLDYYKSRCWCNTGQEMAIVDGVRKCLPCKQGFYGTVLDATYTFNVCKRCPPGQISDLGATTCTPCPLGKIANKLQNGCVDCEIGTVGKINVHLTYGDWTSCVPCTAAASSQYTKGVSLTQGATTCSACPIGKTVQSVVNLNTCVDCINGTYGTLNNTVDPFSAICQVCPLNTYSLTTQIGCISCPPGFKYNHTEGTVYKTDVHERCSKCPVGKYHSPLGEIGCLSCGKGKYADIMGSSNCKLCPVGLYQPNEGSHECVRCGAGTFNPQTGASTCIKCSKGKFSDGLFPSIQTCTACSLGKYSEDEAASTCKNCESGKYANESAQFECECPSLNHVALPNGTGEVKCEIGSIPVGPCGTACKRCPLGKIYNTESTGCTCIENGYVSNLQRTGKVPCATAGTFASGNCQGQNLSTSEMFSCQQCPAGKWVASNPYGGNSECACAPMGHIPNEQQSERKGCPPGTYNDKECASSCTKCPPGRYAPSIGSTACTYADDASIVNQNRTGTTRCPLGTKKDTRWWLNQCFSCPQGKYGTNGIQCTGCSKGFFAANVNSKQCSACPAGKYSTCSTGDECAITNCTNCPIGKFRSFTGASSCDKVPNGTVVNKDASGYDYCKAGTISVENRNECHRCPKGKSTKGASGASICETCLAGKAAVSIGSPTCDSCGPGTFSANNPEECSLCPLGKFSNAPQDNAMCYSCESGHVATSLGSTNCTRCGPGTFSDDDPTKCTLCPVGKQQPFISERSCELCDRGYAASATGTHLCQKCTQGKTSAGYIDQINKRGGTRCEFCPPGKKQAEDVGTNCTLCREGYAAPTNGAVSCQECTPGKTSTGYIDQINKKGGTRCALCPPGKGQAEDIGTNCTLCREGLAATNNGTGFCQKCTPGKISTGYIDQINKKGATKCEFCPPGKGQAEDVGSGCVLCREGYAATNKGTGFCQKCGRGAISQGYLDTVKKKGATKCTKCAAGEMQDGDVGTICKLCPEGTSTNGMSGFGGKCYDFSQCPHGGTNEVAPRQYECDGTLKAGGQRGGRQCLYCAPNTYAANTGQAECTKAGFLHYAYAYDGCGWGSKERHNCVTIWVGKLASGITPGWLTHDKYPSSSFLFTHCRGGVLLLLIILLLCISLCISCFPGGRLFLKWIYISVPIAIILLAFFIASTLLVCFVGNIVAIIHYSCVIYQETSDNPKSTFVGSTLFESGKTKVDHSCLKTSQDLLALLNSTFVGTFADYGVYLQKMWLHVLYPGYKIGKSMAVCHCKSPRVAQKAKENFHIENVTRERAEYFETLFHNYIRYPFETVCMSILFLLELCLFIPCYLLTLPFLALLSHCQCFALNEDITFWMQQKADNTKTLSYLLAQTFRQYDTPGDMATTLSMRIVQLQKFYIILWINMLGVSKRDSKVPKNVNIVV